MSRSRSLLHCGTDNRVRYRFNEEQNFRYNVLQSVSGQMCVSSWLAVPDLAFDFPVAFLLLEKPKATEDELFVLG